MTPTDPNSFHDPELKLALRRVWTAETAPATLRERVQAMGIGAARARAADVMPAPARGRRAWAWPLRYPRPVYGLAAVVTTVIGFAIAYQLDQPPAWRSASSVSMVSANFPDVVPASVARGLVDVHARCQDKPNHESFSDIPRDDLMALRGRLQAQLGFPVLAAPLDDGPERWDFRGAALCPIGKAPAAHLVFARKGQAVSIFSLPRWSCPDAHDGQMCEDLDPSHPLAVFVGRRGVHCVIVTGDNPDGSPSPAQLRTLCDRLQPLLER